MEAQTPTEAIQRASYSWITEKVSASAVHRAGIYEVYLKEAAESNSTRALNIFTTIRVFCVLELKIL